MSSPREKLIRAREDEQRKLAAILDIDPEQSPLAYSVEAKAHDRLLVGAIDGLVHALAALEKELPSRGS